MQRKFMFKQALIVILIFSLSLCYAGSSNNSIEYVRVEPFVYDVALSKDETVAYVTSVKGFASVDLKTKKVTYLPIGKYPNHIKISKKGDKAFVSLREGKIAIVDLETHQVSYIKVDGAPQQMILSDDEKTMYVANVTIGLTVVDLVSKQVSYVDIRDLIEEKYIKNGVKNAQVFSIDLTHDESTLYLASALVGIIAVNTKDLTYSRFNQNFAQSHIKLSEDDATLYIVGRWALKAVSLQDKKEILTLKTSDSILDIEFLNNGNPIFTYNYQGLAVIKNNKLVPISKVKGRARKVVLTEDNHTAYIADYEYGLGIVELKN